MKGPRPYAYLDKWLLKALRTHQECRRNIDLNEAAEAAPVPLKLASFRLNAINFI
ncbi:MAG: hypothetical protein JO356_09010 [Acidobacteria bacterium]|nr:hypothetical protein [Acidobacteriota bacterium]